jgi:hypothetical protein
MTKATRPTIAAKTLLPAASMLAPLPGVKVAGAEVVAFVGGAVLATPVPVATVVLLATGKGAAIVMVSGAIDDTGALVTTGVEEVVAGVDEEGVDDPVDDDAAGVEEATGAGVPLGPTQGMVSMKTGKHWPP